MYVHYGFVHIINNYVCIIINCDYKNLLPNLGIHHWGFEHRTSQKANCIGSLVIPLDETDETSLVSTCALLNQTRSCHIYDKVKILVSYCVHWTCIIYFNWK